MVLSRTIPFYDNIIYNRHLEDSFYELSQLNIESNERNKAFLFGINYVIVSDDQDYRDELDQMFDVKYQSEEQIELEAQLFVVQILFQSLFSQGRLKDAKNYDINHKKFKIIVSMKFIGNVLFISRRI